jgi:hypothetical protein
MKSIPAYEKDVRLGKVSIKAMMDQVKGVAWERKLLPKN